MSARPRPQHANPLLGIYFGIFLASFLAIALLLLIFEQLGMAEERIRTLLTIGSIGFYTAIGAAVFTTEPAQFFLAHRRIPPVFAGLALAVTAIGGTGLVAFSGALFLAGFDALCIPIGILAGLVAMVILIAPYIRKFGAPSVPGYLGMRFDSLTVRLTAASLAAAPLILLIVAELKVALLALSWLVDWSDSVAITSLLLALIVMLVPGGARSLSWSSAAQAIAALLAILIPATIIAVMMSNLPIGQLSHGAVLRQLSRTELQQGLPASIAAAMSFELPKQALQPIVGVYAKPFSSVGSLSFVLVTLCIMAGIAASPGHLGRCAVTTSVYETRKSLGWSVLVAGILIMTLSANAVFFREILMNQLAGAVAGNLPPGIKMLFEHGLAGLDPAATKLAATSFTFKRDGVVIALPMLMGFPVVLVLLVAAGVLAAALSAVAASLTQLAIIVGEDVVIGLPGEAPSASSRMLAARVAIPVVAGIGGFGAMITTRDPMDLMLWSLSLSGSALFPVLLLSIWWKRINSWGALAGMAAGFAVALTGLVAGALGVTRFPEELAAVFGIPAGFAAAICVSLLTPAPGRHVLEMVRDLRVPGGETLHDRELRLQRQKRAQNR